MQTREGAGAPSAALAGMLADLEHTLAAERAAIEGLRAHYQELLRRLKNERAHAHDLAWALEELEQRLRDLEAQREGPPDPLLERELASIAHQRAALEEQALAQMLTVDELAARCAAEAQALAEREQAWAAREAALLAERERIRELLRRQRPEEGNQG
jgi:methylthioribose-1-phosphate isomerase